MMKRHSIAELARLNNPVPTGAVSDAFVPSALLLGGLLFYRVLDSMGHYYARNKQRNTNTPHSTLLHTVSPGEFYDPPGPGGVTPQLSLTPGVRGWSRHMPAF